MTATRNNPSIDPAFQGSLPGSIQFAFKKLMQATDGMLPAKVVAFDREANRVQVQILIAMQTTDGDLIPRAQVASIPVLNIGGGGFLLNFNLKPNDLGWIVASDRDISLFLQGYENRGPNTARMKSFSDGLFIPHVMTGYTIADEDAENAVLQNLDGTVRISIFPDKVKITAPSLEVDGELVATNGITVTGSGTPVNITGNFLITGDIRVVGNITASGDITPHVP